MKMEEVYAENAGRGEGVQLPGHAWYAPDAKPLPPIFTFDAVKAFEEDSRRARDRLHQRIWTEGMVWGFGFGSLLFGTVSVVILFVTW